MNGRARCRVILPVALGLLLLAAPAHAGLAEGIVDVLSAPFEIPKQILVGTFTGPPILGTVAGAFSGAFSAVGRTLRGVGEIASGALGLGSALAPYALPFVL